MTKELWGEPARKVIEQESKLLAKQKRLNFDFVSTFAKKELEKNLEFRTQAFAEVKKDGEYGQGIIVLALPNSEAVRKGLDKTINEELKSERYIFVNEGWMSNVNEGDKPFVRPSRDVNRKEALMISEFRKGELGFSRIMIFEKKDNKIVWKEQQDIAYTDNENIFNVYDKDVIKKLEKHDEEMNDAFFKKQAKIMADKYKEEFRTIETEEQAKEFMKKVVAEVKAVKKKQNQTILEEVDPDEKDKWNDD